MKNIRMLIRRGLKVSEIFCLLIILASCSNLFNKDNKDNSEIKYGTISGSISIEGAVPRTAFATVPDLATLTLDIIVINESNVVDQDAVVTKTPDNKSYTITGLVISKQYKMYATLVSGSTVLFSSDWTDEISISEDDPVLIQNFVLSPESTGNGTISLDVTVDSDTGIQSANIKGQLNSAAKSGNTYTFGNTNVSSGACEMTFCFYSRAGGTGELLYSFTESVNVLPNLETSTWVQNGASPWLQTSTDDSGNTSTICHITKELVDNFRIRNIYVDPTATTTSESGTQLNPCKTISKAIEKLNDADTDYTIHIKGTLTGAQTIPDTLTKDSTDTSKPYHAKSLTLCGANGLDDTGEPQDRLNGGFDSSNPGTTLTLSTDVPVTIKNLLIIGGHSDDSSEGGGLNVFGNADVTLDSGAVIKGNHAEEWGGGIVVNGTSCILRIKSGAEISGNTADNGSGAISIESIKGIEIGGSAYIPAGSSKRNSVTTTSTDGVNPYKIKITSPLEKHTASNPIVLDAGWFPEGTQLVEAAEGVNLADEVKKISINPYNGKNCMLDSEGKLVFRFGTKAASETKSKGDIVFNDGSATPYTSDLVLNDLQKAAAIAVIFGTVDSNKVGVGLKEAGGAVSCKIADDGVNGIKNTVGASSATDGLTNTEKFKNQTDYSEKNYPAIYWAYNYSNKAGNLGTYNSDWYVPASKELEGIYKEMSTINNAFTKIGNSAVKITSDRQYNSSTEKNATYCICNKMNNSTMDLAKNSNCYFRFVHRF